MAFHITLIVSQQHVRFILSRQTFTRRKSCHYLVELLQLVRAVAVTLDIYL